MIRNCLALLALLPACVLAERQWLDENFAPVEQEEASFYLDGPLLQQGEVWPISVHYLDGVLRLEGVLDGPDLRDDGLVGGYRFYHANGTLEEEGSRDPQSRPHGEVMGYHANGQLRYRRHFRHGVLHGESSEFHPNGQLESRTEFVEGRRRDGECLHYDEEGVLAARHAYLNDKLEGPAERYRQGVLLSREHYRGGVLDGVQLSFHADGGKSSEYSLRQGQREGAETRWHENGELFLQSHYRKGEQHGVFRRYSDNGTLVEEAEYRDGRKVGLRREYYSSGELHSEELYDAAGERQRRVQFDAQGNRLAMEVREQGAQGMQLRSEHYRADGSLESRVQRTADERWQLREAFAEDGSLIERYEQRQGRDHGLRLTQGWQGDRQELHFRDGKRDGLYRVTSRSGEVIEQGSYRADHQVGEWLQLSELARSIARYDDRGRLHGEQRSETPEGVLLSREHYRHGQRHGRFERYESGELVEAGDYREDQPEGVWKKRFYDGLAWQGRYHRGAQVGLWQALSAEGYLLALSLYDEQGRPTGTHYSFAEDGALLRIERYRDGQQHGPSEYFAEGRRYLVMHFEQGQLLESEEAPR